MKLIVVGDKETVMLFALEGVEGRVVASQAEANEEIRRVRKSRAYGLMIVTEQVVEWAQDQVSQLRFSKELPVVVDIPDISGGRENIKKLGDFIREAVGIRV